MVREWKRATEIILIYTQKYAYIHTYVSHRKAYDTSKRQRKWIRTATNESTKHRRNGRQRALKRTTDRPNVRKINRIYGICVFSSSGVGTRRSGQVALVRSFGWCALVFTPSRSLISFHSVSLTSYSFHLSFFLTSFSHITCVGFSYRSYPLLLFA